MNFYKCKCGNNARSSGIYKGYCRKCKTKCPNHVPKRSNPRKVKQDKFSVMSYTGRNRILKRIGFKNYPEYLASPLWFFIREWVLKRDGYKCRFCGKKAKEVHHGEYGKRALLGQQVNRLYSSCGRCHRHLEFDGKGNKRTLVEVLQLTFELLLARSHAQSQ